LRSPGLREHQSVRALKGRQTDCCTIQGYSFSRPRRVFRPFRAWLCSPPETQGCAKRAPPWACISRPFRPKTARPRRAVSPRTPPDGADFFDTLREARGPKRPDTLVALRQARGPTAFCGLIVFGFLSRDCADQPGVAVFRLPRVCSNSRHVP
jgi:hypothetical protein